MLLRPLRRLHRLLVPLQAAAMVAFAVRLGWGHDPQCPHHAGAAAHRAATPQVPAYATHDAHTNHAAHATSASAVSGAAPDAAPRGGADGNCHCLDKDYCLGGATALPQLAAGSPLPEAPLRWVEPAPPIRTLPATCDAYRSHRLPFPNAPPCTVVRS
ncbi:MAG: hypothetical protein HYV19_11930 [Gemmatimonadetes bacterium]|nr:hypothetical protein [Gemmatimonadota bacterium]